MIIEKILGKTLECIVTDIGSCLAWINYLQNSSNN